MSTVLQNAAPPCLAETGGQGHSRVTVLRIQIDDLSRADAVRAVVERLDRTKPSQVCFLNADCVNLARRNPAYLEVLRTADFVLPDGIGLKLAARCSGVRFRENLNGTDLFPCLCEALGGTGKRLFLLGARPGVAEAVARWTAQHYPGVAIAGWQHGYFPPDDEPVVLSQIAQSGADLLLVAFGSPRQDLWIARHLDALGVKVAMGVGGLFDFYSGRIPRAPLWMRRHGLEWLYRLWREPTRLWRRYLLGIPRFLASVALDALGRQPLSKVS